MSTNSQLQKPDVLKIMAAIRSKVKAQVEGVKDTRLTRPVKVADLSGDTTVRPGDIARSEDLKFLNQHYTFAPNLNVDWITSHRGGIIGKAIVFVKRKTLTLVWMFLKTYFDGERQFKAHLIRFLNDSIQYNESRHSTIFWELVKKIDHDVGKTAERLDRFQDEALATIHAAERRVEAGLRDNTNRLESLDSTVKGMEGIVGRVGRHLEVSQRDSTQAVSQEQINQIPDYSYLLLENRFRGSEEEISRRVAPYVEIFQGAKAPVVEIGPGRGELLKLLGKAGIDAYGVDVDAAMVERAGEDGLNVQLGDGISHLRSLKDSSIGGVIAIQVVEHLKNQQLQELLQLVQKKVVTGGKIIFETINPKSLVALSSNYFRDPTHIFPLHPDTLSYACTLAGLKVKEVRMMSPMPDAVKLQRLAVGDFLSNEVSTVVTSLNRSIEQLNELLYGYQDFCIIAER